MSCSRDAINGGSTELSKVVVVTREEDMLEAYEFNPELVDKLIKRYSLAGYIRIDKSMNEDNVLMVRHNSRIKILVREVLPGVC